MAARRAPRTWTAERIGTVRAMAAAGHSGAGIARALGIDPDTFYAAAARHGFRDLLRHGGARGRPRKDAPARRVRPCLCCARLFSSAGAHHRLCNPCRARGSEPWNDCAIEGIGMVARTRSFSSLLGLGMAGVRGRR